MKLWRMLFLLLSFSLILQNTCPHGFAGKTAFAASIEPHACPCQKCPLTKQGPSDNKQQKPLYPAFLMIVPAANPSLHFLAAGTECVFLPQDRYIDPFKARLIKPPIA